MSKILEVKRDPELELETFSNLIMTNDVAFCNITQTTSTDGVMWLNIEVKTSAIVNELIVILYY